MDDILKKIENRLNEETDRNSKVFFDHNDTFSIKKKNFMGFEVAIAHLGGGNVLFDIPQSPEVTKLIGEFYRLVLKEENE